MKCKEKEIQEGYCICLIKLYYKLVLGSLLRITFRLAPWMMQTSTTNTYVVTESSFLSMPRCSFVNLIISKHTVWNYQYQCIQQICIIFIQVECLDPTPKNGQATPSQPSYSDGTTVTFSCNPGYVLMRSYFTNIATCKVEIGYEYEGTYYDQTFISWRPSPPRCEGNT